jgi:hypothetical protein
VKSGSVKPVRCAIYTRVSTDHGLEQDFNSLDAQHDAAQAYIRSQTHAGWVLIRSRYDDAATLAARPSGRRCSGCWLTSGTGRWTSSWSTKSIA